MPTSADLVERIGGVPFTAGAHRTLPLGDPGRIYLVEQGHVDVFAAELRGADVVNRRPFATRAPAGAIVFGATRAVLGDRAFELLGVPSRDAVIVEGERSGLAEGVLDMDLISRIDDWVWRLSEFLARQAGPVPRGTGLLEADPDVPHAAGVTLSAHHNGLFTPVASAVLLAVIWLFLIQGEESSSFGLAAFLIAFSAFGQLVAGVTGLLGAATTVIALVPLVERVKPVLEAEPETAEGRTDPGDFRYQPDSEKVLRGVSLRIRPGDYVAIVGPSGSGKSTIYRLLFGFERPDSGAVLFDGHDLLNLDLEAVRRHLGVVLQDGQAVADSILNNVAGSARLSADEIWEAFRAAGLEDDVRAMPMGLHTMLHEGGGGLSGGQRQRLLIARALARKPRILLLDEATSALDNHTQSVVQDSLGKLSITRIVIAHRLSTVRDVDRIYVLDQGRIAESGRYDELIARDRVFAELARRQLV